MFQNKKMLSIFIVIIYLLLLIPYTIISNAVETGIVIDNQRIAPDSLPNDVQDILKNDVGFYNILLIEYPIPEVNEYQTFANPAIEGQLGKEKKLVFSNEAQGKGSFVRIDSMKTDARVRTFTILNYSFDKLIIGDAKKAAFGGIIETISNHNMTPIISLSKTDTLVGVLLVVATLTFLLERRMVALWNIPAILLGYSFQIFLGDMVGMLNSMKIDPQYLLFGFLFIPVLPLTLWLHEYEKTEQGKQKIYDIYINNNKFLSKIKNKLGMLLHTDDL